MSDVVHIGRSAKNIKESPLFSPFSGVRLTAGKDEEGNAVVYRAGNDSGHVLEVENPWGSQQMADDILQRILGYEYKPYTATGAVMNPAAELGDAVSVGDVYSVLDSVDTVFSPLMSSTIAARESGVLDHEYPYDTKANRETTREIHGVRTQLLVEMGRIQSTIEETYETKTDAGQIKGDLQTQITQTQSQILSTVSATYETKTEAAQMESRLNSSISQTESSITSTVAATYETKAAATSKLASANAYTNSVRSNLQSQIAQTADSITLTVSKAVSKYALPSGITIQNFGYGAPSNSSARGKNGEYYLDQTNGYYYRSNGSSWVKQSNTPQPLITDQLSSKIDQTAASISLQVSGANAPEWTSGNYYAVGDVVKVSTYSDEILISESFYRCIQVNTASAFNKPGNTSFWETANAPTVQSLIDLNLGKITIGTGESGENNSAQITLYKDGVEIAAQTITMSNVVADSISASKITSGTMQADTIGIDGSLSVYVQDNDVRTYCGALGGGYALQPDTRGTQISCPSIAMYSNDRYSYAAVSDGAFVRPSGSNGGYRGFAILHTRSASIYTTSAVIESSNVGGTFVDYNPYAVIESKNGIYYLSFGVSGGLTTGISQASDRRIKKDIDYDMARYEQFFLALKPCSYRLIGSDQSVHTGYIAQDVDDALRDCNLPDSGLVTRHGEEARGFSSDDPMLALEYDEITAIHTHMIQRLVERINALEARL